MEKCFLYAKVLSIYALIRCISSWLGKLCERLHNCVLSFSTDVWDIGSFDYFTKELILFIRSDYGQTVMTKSPALNSQFICGSSLSSIFDIMDLFFFIILILLLIYLKEHQYHIVSFSLHLFCLLNLVIALFIINKLSPFIIPYVGVLSGGQNSIYNTQLHQWNTIALISKNTFYIKILGVCIVVVLLFYKRKLRNVLISGKSKK
jgi:hypothetical protein